MHTGPCEEYNALMISKAPKSRYFLHKAYITKSMITTIDYNRNCLRPTKKKMNDGEEEDQIRLFRQRHENTWKARKVRVKKNQDWIKEILQGTVSDVANKAEIVPIDTMESKKWRKKPMNKPTIEEFKLESRFYVMEEKKKKKRG